MSGRRLTLVLAAFASAIALVAMPTAAQADAPLGLNKAPTARITGSAAGLYVGDTATFSGETSSDPGGKIVAYSWSVSSNGEIVGSSTGKTVAVKLAKAGTITVSLVVTDNGALNGLLGSTLVQQGSTSVSFKATVRPNAAPVFGAPDPQETAPHAYFRSFGINFSDPDGDDVNIVSVVCPNCRGTATIYNNSNNVGTPNAVQREGFTLFTPCTPFNVGYDVTIDDGHGHQTTTHKTLVVFSGPYRCQ